jgi:2-hydroxy-3-oxopropionate reductase
VAAGTTTIPTSLPDDAALRSIVLDGIVRSGSLRPGTLVIDTSTTAPATARDVAGAVEGAGGAFVDAPVSGGEPAAIEGRLSVMCGGSTTDVERARPILDAFAHRIVHIGSVGAGHVAKACDQLVVMVNLEAVAEALVLATVSGIDARRVRDALLGGLAASRVLELAGRRMLEHDHAPGGRARLHLKDIGIIRDATAGTAMAFPAFEQAARRIERLVEEGRGDLDHAAILSVLEAESGATVGAAGG